MLYDPQSIELPVELISKLNQLNYPLCFLLLVAYICYWLVVVVGLVAMYDWGLLHCSTTGSGDDDFLFYYEQ